MGRRRRSKPSAAKVPYTLLTPADHGSAYQRLKALVTAHHEDLRDARIALAYAKGWRCDVDGKITLGRCRKASSLDREMHEWDFVILLNQEWWQDESVTDIQRDALLDHELCHAGVKIDKQTNDPALDERGRIVYRLRKHDLEEFACIAERYGLWKRDLETFAQAMRRSKQNKLPLEQPKEKPTPQGRGSQLVQ